MAKIRVLAIVCLSLVAQATATCRTSVAGDSKNLRSGLAAMAQVVKEILQQDKLDAIALGPFVGPTSTGPGIVEILAEELAKRQVHIKEKTSFTIRGEFEFSKANHTLQITAKIVDRFGGAVQDLNLPEITDGNDVKRAGVQQGKIEIQTKDERSLLALAGVNVAIPPDARPEERNGMIFDGLKDPSATLLSGTKLIALTTGGAKSPYGLEIVVNGQTRPITQTKVDPEPWVRINPGEAYEVRIFNESAYDAALELRIDGVSSFAFSDLRQPQGPQRGEPLYDHWIVPAGKRVLIKGWHKDNAAVDSFLVTRFAKGAAAQLLNALSADASKFGTISATFSAAWPEDASPPPDEPPRKKGMPNLTGKGPPREMESTELRRFVGVPRASVSVRYSK